MLPIILGSAGVGLLLLAFVLNLTRRLTESSAIYLWMNILGCLLAGIYAWVGEQYPFVVLETVWGAAAAIKLLRGSKTPPRPEAAGA